MSPGHRVEGVEGRHVGLESPGAEEGGSSRGALDSSRNGNTQPLKVGSLIVCRAAWWEGKATRFGERGAWVTGSVGCIFLGKICRLSRDTNLAGLGEGGRREKRRRRRGDEIARRLTARV